MLNGWQKVKSSTIMNEHCTEGAKIFLAFFSAEFLEMRALWKLDIIPKGFSIFPDFSLTIPE